MTARDKNGIHLPNAPLRQFTRTVGGPAEPEAFWWRMGAGKFTWAKLLWPEHTRADAEMLKSLGVNVLVRAPGEGEVHHEDVARMIDEFKGVASIIEVGNEPPDIGWNHAWYLEDVYINCAAQATAARITLCAPGWRAGQPPPQAPDFDAGLVQRLRAVYSLYQAQAVHVYDSFDINAPEPQNHLRDWLNWRQVPAFVTEYGIAARAIPDGIKAVRYAQFVKSLPADVVAAFAFIMGGTPDFAAFNGGGYDAKGANSYWLHSFAWDTLGSLLDN